MADDQDFLRAAADMGSERVAAYTLFQDYYDGEQRTQLGERERKFLEASGLRFAENFCETVIDITNERLRVVGFDIEGKPTLSEIADDRWKRNRMPANQAVIHEQAMVKGDAFMIVDLDPMSRARFTWNPSERVKVCYSDDTDEPEYAVKVWNTSAVSFVNPRGETITRMNLYFPDRIERYFTITKQNEPGNMWFRYVEIDRESNLPTGWPIPWVDAAGEPLGIPVFHFKNKARGSRYGKSDLLNVIPQQDGLNKLVLDLFNVQDQQGWPARWGTGIENDDGLEVAIGDLLTTTASDAKFGQFDAADPKGTLDSIASNLQRMAARSRTPLHLLMMGGTLPSGESLKTAEAPLVKKVEDRQGGFGQTWEDAVKMGFRLESAFGSLPQEFDPENDMIEAKWDDAESRNETVFYANQLVKQQLGVSQDTLLREAGYDPETEAEKRQVEHEESVANQQDFAQAMSAGTDTAAQETYNG